MPNSNTDTNSTRSQEKDVASSAKKVASEAKDQLGSAASSVASRVEDAAVQVKERSQELLHGAADRAGDYYQSASDYAQHAAHEARETAMLAGRYARRAGGAGVSFLGTHAMPLTLVGLGLGWLALSIREQSRLRSLEDSYMPSQSRQLPTMRGAERTPIAGNYEPSASDGTTGSNKLLGVRQIEPGRSYPY